MEQFLKTLSEINRIRIVNLLSKGHFSVGEITKALESSQSLVSHHLKVLLTAGILSQYKQGRMVFYCLNNSIEKYKKNILNAITEWCLKEEVCRHDEARGKNLLRLRHNRSKEFFAHHAPHWDTLSSAFIDFEQSISILKKYFSPKSCNTIVDLGTGTGRLIKHLLQVARNVVGVDNSYAMLEQARNRIRNNRVEFRLGELEHLPFQDSFCEGAVIHYVLHHCVRPDIIFPEVHRILKRDGVLVVFDFLQHNQESAMASMGDLWLGFTKKELKSWLRRGGFEIKDFIVFPSPHEEINSIVIKSKKI